MKTRLNCLYFFGLIVGVLYITTGSFRLNSLLEELYKEPQQETADERNDNLNSGEGYSDLNSFSRSVIPLGQRHSHSSHFCMGPHDMLPLYRSCHFTDVCFDAEGTMLYIQENGDDENEPDDPETIKTAIRAQSIRQCPRKDCERPDDAYLIPRILSSNDPTYRNPDKVWSPIPFAIPYTAFNAQNFGHAIGDNILPFYRLLQLFGVYTDTVDFLPLRYDCTAEGVCVKDGMSPTVLTIVLDPFLLNTQQSKNQNKTVLHGEFHNYYRHLVNSYYSQNNSIINNKSNDTLICFENVLSGLYFLTDHGEDENYHGKKPQFGTNSVWVGKGDILKAFRRDYMRRIGVSDQLDLHYHCQECHFLKNSAISSSSNNNNNNNNNSHMGTDVWILSRPENTYDGGWDNSKLLKVLNQGCLGDKGRTFRVLNAPAMSMVDQVEAVATSKVLISMVGGASLISWFLPPGALNILLPRGEGATLDSHVFDNLPYLHQYVPTPVLTTLGPRGKYYPNHVFDYEDICRQARRGIERYEATIQRLSPPCGGRRGAKCTLRRSHRDE